MKTLPFVFNEIKARARRNFIGLSAIAFFSRKGIVMIN